MLRHFCTVLVLDYKEEVFRSSNSGSIDIQTESVLSAVWQLAAFKVTLNRNKIEI